MQEEWPGSILQAPLPPLKRDRSSQTEREKERVPSLSFLGSSFGQRKRLSGMWLFKILVKWNNAQKKREKLKKKYNKDCFWRNNNIIYVAQCHYSVDYWLKSESQFIIKWQVNEWCFFFFSTYNLRFTLRLLVRSGRLSFNLPSYP